MRDKDQQIRFSNQELAQLKGLFADNEDLLYLVRKVMFQFPINDAEKTVLAGAMNETVFVLLTKIFNPWLEPDSPIGQMASLMLSLGPDVKTTNPDTAWPYIKAKEIEIQYISQQLAVLNGGTEKPKVILSELEDLSGPKTTREQKFINVLVWNFLIQFIDSSINQIKVLAGQKHETVEETMERLRKDSTK